MTPVVNQFTGTDGTALSSGNVSGFNQVSGTAPVIQANKAVFAAASGGTSLLRVNLDATGPTAAAEMQMPLGSTAPTSDEVLLSLRHSAGSACTLRHVASTGRVKVVAADGTTVLWTSTNVYLGGEFRFFMWVTVGTATTGRVHLETYIGQDRVATETYDSGAAVNMGTNPLVAVQIGRQLTPAYAFTYTYNDLRIEAGRTTRFGPLMTLDTVGLGVVGDSQVYQGGAGNGDGGNVETGLVTYGGWDAAHVTVDGVIGRSISGVAVLPSAPQSIDAMRLTGWDPRTWLISLGGNGIHDSLALQKSYITILLDKITSGTTGVYRVYWMNVVRQDTADTEVDRFWQALTEIKAARTDCEFLPYDLDSAIHNGRDETGLWSGDGVHMSTAGYNIRNQLVGTYAALNGPPVVLPPVVSAVRRRDRVGSLRSRIG